jgi:hypothetical protein
MNEEEERHHRRRCFLLVFECAKKKRVPAPIHSLVPGSILADFDV